MVGMKNISNFICACQSGGGQSQADFFYNQRELDHDCDNIDAKLALAKTLEHDFSSCLEKGLKGKAARKDFSFEDHGYRKSEGDKYCKESSKKKANEDFKCRCLYYQSTGACQNKDCEFYAADRLEQNQYKIIAYQIPPVENIEKQSGFKSTAVDLVMVDRQDTSRVYLVEVKDRTSKEHLLRMTCECLTISAPLLNPESNFADYVTYRLCGLKGRVSFEEFMANRNAYPQNKDYTFIQALAFYNNSEQAREYMSRLSPGLKTLMEKNKMAIFKFYTSGAIELYKQY